MPSSNKNHQGITEFPLFEPIATNAPVIKSAAIPPIKKCPPEYLNVIAIVTNIQNTYTHTP